MPPPYTPSTAPARYAFGGCPVLGGPPTHDKYSEKSTFSLLAALGLLLAALVPLLIGPLLASLEPLLAALRSLWAALGPLWATLGPLLATLWPLLGCSWPLLGHSWLILRQPWPLWARSWRLLAAPRAILEALGHSGGDLLNLQRLRCLSLDFLGTNSENTITYASENPTV